MLYTLGWAEKFKNAFLVPKVADEQNFFFLN